MEKSNIEIEPMKSVNTDSELLNRLEVIIYQYNNEIEYKMADNKTFIKMKMMEDEMYYLAKRLRVEEGIKIIPSLSFYLKTYTW